MAFSPVNFGPAVAAYETSDGSAAKNNIRIKEGAVGIRFTAHEDSAVESITVAWTNRNSSYGGGDGGTYRCGLQELDGSGYPDGSWVDGSYEDDAIPIQVYPASFSHTWTFSSGPVPVSGTKYAIVIENVDASPNANYGSINFPYNGAQSSHPLYEGEDTVVLNGSGAYVTAYDYTDSDSKALTCSPAFDIEYANGDHQGFAGIHAEVTSAVGKITSSTDLEWQWTHYGDDITFDLVGLYAYRISGTADFTCEVFKDDVSVATGTFLASSALGVGYSNSDWVTATLDAEVAATAGDEIRVVFSVASGEYWAQVMLCNESGAVDRMLSMPFDGNSTTRHTAKQNGSYVYSAWGAYTCFMSYVRLVYEEEEEPPPDPGGAGEVTVHWSSELYIPNTNGTYTTTIDVGTNPAVLGILVTQCGTSSWSAAASMSVGGVSVTERLFGSSSGQRTFLFDVLGPGAMSGSQTVRVVRTAAWGEAYVQAFAIEDSNSNLWVVEDSEATGNASGWAGTTLDSGTDTAIGIFAGTTIGSASVNGVSGSTVVTTGARRHYGQESEAGVGSRVIGAYLGGVHSRTIALYGVEGPPAYDETPDPLDIVVTLPAPTVTGPGLVIDYPAPLLLEVVLPEPIIFTSAPRALVTVGVHDAMPGRVNPSSGLTTPYLGETNGIPEWKEMPESGEPADPVSGPLVYAKNIASQSAVSPTPVSETIVPGWTSNKLSVVVSATSTVILNYWASITKGSSGGRLYLVFHDGSGWVGSFYSFYFGYSNKQEAHSMVVLPSVAAGTYDYSVYYAAVADTSSTQFTQQNLTVTVVAE